MSVYVDKPFRHPLPSEPQARRVALRHDGWWCHLWTDPGNEAELHRTAREIGMRPEWFQNRTGFPHYDITVSRRAAALRAGAIEMKLSDWIKSKRRQPQTT